MRRALSCLQGRVDLQDLLILFGVATLSAGAGMVYRPAALLVAGGLLFALGVGLFAPRKGTR